MDHLAAMRDNVDIRAVYDADSHAALINTGKYAELHDMLWRVFVPKKAKSNARLDFAAKALLYTKSVFAVWLHGCITSCEVGPEFPEHCFYEPEYCCLEQQRMWLWVHCTEIDRFAAEGTHPARHVRTHHVFLPLATQKPTSALRNLHRLKDAVTLAAYWTIMQDYEILGTLLMRQRLQKTICCQGVFGGDVGLLGDIPVACLDNILHYLC